MKMDLLELCRRCLAKRTTAMITIPIIIHNQSKLKPPRLGRLKHLEIYLKYIVSIILGLYLSGPQQYCFPYSPQQYFASYGKPSKGQRNCPNLVPL